VSCIEEIIAKRERVAAMYVKRLARVPGVCEGCAGCACRTYAAPGVTCTSWFMYVVRVRADEVNGEEPTPERQHPEQRSSERQLLERGSAVRDHMMRRSEEPNASWALAFLRPRGAVGLGQVSKMGRGEGAPPYFGTVRLQPFCRAEFGFKEGDFPVTELAGRTSIAIPFHNHLTVEEIDYVAGVLERALGEM